MDFISQPLSSGEIKDSGLTITITPPMESSASELPLTPPGEGLNSFVLDHRPTHSLIRKSSFSHQIVAVVGVGYVGFHLVEAFSKHYLVIALDVSKERLNQVASQLNTDRVYFTTDPADLVQASHILIAVPTRVDHEKKVDAKPLTSAIASVAKNARPGATIVIESSVAVGMTRELLEPLVLTRGFLGGMSPERVDPGRTDVEFEAIPKVVSGLNEASLQSIRSLYEPVFDKVVTVSKPEVAEMTKLYENCQRMVCIAYANEMADACGTLDIDPLEVCGAAATKPFGFQSYLPGPGVGGHCIPVNPYYLLSNTNFPLLQAATERMWQRPAMLADRVMQSLNKEQFSHTTCPANARPLMSPRRKSLQEQRRILVVGVGFKPGQSVLSHSPGVALITHFLTQYDNIFVDFTDPLVPASALNYVPKLDEKTEWNRRTIEQRYDAVVVACAQWGLDLDVLQEVEGVQVHNFTAAMPWSTATGEIRRSSC